MFRQQQITKFIGSVAFGFAIMAFTTTASRGQSADAPSKEPLIESTGSGRVQRAPDRVDISVGIEAIETTASGAQVAAEKVMKATVAALRDLKLADEQLQTGRVDLSPRYERRDNSELIPNKIIGYTGSISLTIRTSNLESPAQVIDAALNAGCNRINYVSFTLRELLEAREEAIKLATKAAKRKAEVMAEALDMKLVRVSKANTTSGGGWWGSNRMSNSVQVARDSGGGDGGDGEAVVPGKIDVTADVTISFVAAAK